MKIAGMPITSIIAQTSEANPGRCMTRPRRALNQSSRPSTANASVVVARATSAAVIAQAISGSVVKKAWSRARFADEFIVGDASDAKEGGRCRRQCSTDPHYSRARPLRAIALLNRNRIPVRHCTRHAALELSVFRGALAALNPGRPGSDRRRKWGVCVLQGPILPRFPRAGRPPRNRSLYPYVYVFIAAKNYWP